ncbi:MAG: hypothetical protein RLZZ420_451 [Bacteroidota bacterium]|jgi:hypothetical protein
MTTNDAYTFPVKFEDVHYIASLYTANSEKVNTLLNGTGLKAGLHFFGKPTVALGLINYKKSDLGAYNEIILSIPVVQQHEKTGWANWIDLYANFDKRKGGQYIIHIPVTTQVSVDAGRTLWGYPKTLLPIIHNFESGGINTLLLNEVNKPLITVKGNTAFEIPIPAMPLMTYSFLNDTLLKTTVDISCRMKCKINSGLTIHVADLDHPIGKSIRELGIDNKKPIFTIESKHFKAGFNKGQIIAQ